VTTQHTSLNTPDKILNSEQYAWMASLRQSSYTRVTNFKNSLALAHYVHDKHRSHIQCLVESNGNSKTQDERKLVSDSSITLLQVTAGPQRCSASGVEHSQV